MCTPKYSHSYPGSLDIHGIAYVLLLLLLWNVRKSIDMEWLIVNNKISDSR